MRDVLLIHGHLVVLGILLGAALAGAVAERATRAFLAGVRWRTRTARRSLRRRRSVEPGAVGRFRGVIRIEGEPAECFGGRPCAVATAAARPRRGDDFASVSTRAPRLVLEVDGQRVALIGDIDVIAPGPVGTAVSRSPDVSARIAARVGAQDAWQFEQLPTELRRVADGEHIEIAGRVVQRAGDLGGYRITAASLTIEGAGGALLVSPRRNTRRTPWLGAFAAAITALSVTGGLAEAGAPSTDLISLLHRADALSAIRDWDVERLTPSQLEARLVLLEGDDHAGRASTLRALGRFDDALLEAERGSDAAAAHEALSTRLRMPRGPSTLDAWLTLASRIDAACAKTDACEDRDRVLVLTRTPSRWATPRPNRGLLDVLFSSEAGHAGAPLTLLLGRGLLEHESKGTVVTQLRALWLLEYAALLIQLGDEGEAERALTEVERSIEALPEHLRSPVDRDAHDLREIIALRASVNSDNLRCTGCRDPGWCRSQRRAEDACDPRRPRDHDGWNELPLGFVTALRTAELSGQLLSSERGEWLRASRIEQARWMVPELGVAAHASLVVRLVNEFECETTPTAPGVIREHSRARALRALGVTVAAERVRECVDRGREELLEGR